MGNSTPRPHFTPGKDPVPILQKAGWAPGPVWTGGNSPPHRDSILNLQAVAQSLYRLSYPAHNITGKDVYYPDQKMPNVYNILCRKHLLTLIYIYVCVCIVFVCVCVYCVCVCVCVCIVFVCVCVVHLLA